MIAWFIDSMGIRGSFIDVSVYDEGAKIERFIIIEIVNKLCSKQTQWKLHSGNPNTPYCYEKYCLDILDHVC